MTVPRWKWRLAKAGTMAGKLIATFIAGVMSMGVIDFLWHGTKGQRIVMASSVTALVLTLWIIWSFCYVDDHHEEMADAKGKRGRGI